MTICLAITPSFAAVSAALAYHALVSATSSRSRAIEQVFFSDNPCRERARHVYPSFASRLLSDNNVGGHTHFPYDRVSEARLTPVRCSIIRHDHRCRDHRRGAGRLPGTFDELAMVASVPRPGSRRLASVPRVIPFDSCPPASRRGGGHRDPVARFDSSRRRPVEGAHVEDLVAADRPHVGCLQRYHRHRGASRRDELHFIRRAISVAVDDGADVFSAQVMQPGQRLWQAPVVSGQARGSVDDAPTGGQQSYTTKHPCP